MLVSEISFPDSKKEVVSGIEMQNGLSVIFFNQYGEEGFRLVEVKFRFPFPLQRGEAADVALKHVRDTKVGDAILQLFSAQMYGRTSKKCVLYGTFMVAPV